MRTSCVVAGMLAAAGAAYGIAPALVVAFVPNDAGMAVSILLLYVLYPALSIALGVVIARALYSLWWVPGVFAGLFLPLFCFAMGASVGDLWLYAVGYAAVGYIAAVTGFALMRDKRAAS